MQNSKYFEGADVRDNLGPALPCGEAPGQAGVARAGGGTDGKAMRDSGVQAPRIPSVSDEVRSTYDYYCSQSGRAPRRARDRACPRRVIDRALARPLRDVYSLHPPPWAFHFAVRRWQRLRATYGLWRS